MIGSIGLEAALRVAGTFAALRFARQRDVGVFRIASA
jgi:hypothetical protein